MPRVMLNNKAIFVRSPSDKVSVRASASIIDVLQNFGIRKHPGSVCIGYGEQCAIFVCADSTGYPNRHMNNNPCKAILTAVEHQSKL